MKKFLVLIILLSLPTFGQLFRFGLHTMHDPHLFRLYEFAKCFTDGAFPCRWAADSGMGYGEPLFNFYGQFPYWLGQIFILLGSSVIDALKLTFILSLVLSGFSMYLLASKYYGKSGGLVSAVFYLYAPYRAVDVWVRGALPEALGFVFFPLIFYAIDEYLDTRRLKHLFIFILALAGLIITHNLSAFMFLPFIVLWSLARLKSLKNLILLPRFFLAALLSLLLIAFYLVPVILEGHLTTVNATTQGYYLYQLHFASLKQLFISNFWGYGGSTWGPNDTLSFSVGYLHWLVVILIGILAVFRKRISPIFIISTVFGVLAIFLTHGKSEFLWKLIPGSNYVQFPWRFLTLSTFFLSLSAGALVRTVPKLVTCICLTLAIAVTGSLFRPDIWQPISDASIISGKLWDEGRSSSLSDYWPKSASHLPTAFAPENPIVKSGEATTWSSEKKSQTASYSLRVFDSYAKVVLPIVYFPGWTLMLDNQPTDIVIDSDLGLISTIVPVGDHTLSLRFTDTPARGYGNLISIISLSLLALAALIYAKKHKTTS